MSSDANLNIRAQFTADTAQGDKLKKLVEDLRKKQVEQAAQFEKTRYSADRISKVFSTISTETHTLGDRVEKFNATLHKGSLDFKRYDESSQNVAASSHRMGSVIGEQTGAFGALGNAMKQAETAQTNVAQSSDGLRGKLGTLGQVFSDQALGLTATTMAGVALVKNWTDLSDTANDLVGKEITLARTKEDLQDAQEKVNRMQEEGKTGTFEYQQALDDLQITQQELTEATEDVRVTQEKLKNEQTEFALSVLPTVISAAANLKGMYDGLKDAGISFSGTLPKLTGGLKSLGTTLKGLGLTNPFFIALTAGTALMTAFATNAFGLRDAINGVGKALGDALPHLKPLLDGLGWLGEQIGGVFGTAEATTTAATQNMTREVVRFGFETKAAIGGVADIVEALSAAFEGSKSNVTQFMGDIHLLQRAVTEFQLTAKNVEGEEGIKNFAKDMHDTIVPMLDSLIALYPDHTEQFEAMKTALATNLVAPDASKIEELFTNLINLMGEARVKVIEYNDAQRGTFQTAVENAKLIDEQVLALSRDEEAKKKDIVTTYELGKASGTLTGTTEQLAAVLSKVVDSEILATKQNLLLEEALAKSNITTQEQLNTLALWAPAMRDLSTEFDSTNQLISQGRDVLTEYFQSQASVEDKMKVFNALLKGESIPAVQGLNEADMAFIKIMQEMIKTGTGNNDMLATFGEVILGTADDTETATEALYTYEATQKKIKDTEAERIAGLQELAQEMTGVNAEQITNSKTLSDLIIMGAKQKDITNDVAVAVEELSIKHALDARQKEIDTAATWAFAAATHGVITPIGSSIEFINKLIQSHEQLNNATQTGRENIVSYIFDLKAKQAIEEAENKTLAALTMGHDDLLDAFGRTNSGMKTTIEVMLGTEKGMAALADMAKKSAEEFQKAWEEGLNKTKAIFAARTEEFTGVLSTFGEVAKKAIQEGKDALSDAEKDIFKNIPKEIKTAVKMEMQGEEAIQEFFSDYMKGDAKEAVEELEEAILATGQETAGLFTERRKELEGMGYSAETVANILYNEFGTDPFKTITLGMQQFQAMSMEGVDTMDNFIATMKFPDNIATPLEKTAYAAEQVIQKFGPAINEVDALKSALDQYNNNEIDAAEFLAQITARAHELDAQIPGSTSVVADFASGLDDLRLTLQELPPSLRQFAEVDMNGMVTNINAIGTATAGLGESIRTVDPSTFEELGKTFENIHDVSDLPGLQVDVAALGTASNKLKDDKVGPEELGEGFKESGTKIGQFFSLVGQALRIFPGEVKKSFDEAGTNTAGLATHMNTTRGKVFTSIGGMNQAFADVPKAVDNMAKSVMTPISKFYNNLQAGFNKTVGLAKETEKSLRAVQSAANALKSKSVTYTTTHVSVYKTVYAQHGMDEVVTGPRTIHVGEHGKAERVTVTPLTNPNDSADKTLQPMALNRANVKVKGINDLPSLKSGNQSSQSVSINGRTSSGSGADVMTMFTQMRQDMREQLEMIVNRMGRNDMIYNKIDLILEHYQLAPLAEVTQQVALKKNSSSM